MNNLVRCKVQVSFENLADRESTSSQRLFITTSKVAESTLKTQASSNCRTTHEINICARALHMFRSESRGMFSSYKAQNYKAKAQKKFLLMKIFILK